jgi:division protein CdvB (Snf7/Vps24/ESCRT-III family)
MVAGDSKNPQEVLGEKVPENLRKIRDEIGVISGYLSTVVTYPFIDTVKFDKLVEVLKKKIAEYEELKKKIAEKVVG